LLIRFLPSDGNVFHRIRELRRSILKPVRVDNLLFHHCRRLTATRASSPGQKSLQLQRSFASKDVLQAKPAALAADNSRVFSGRALIKDADLYLLDENFRTLTCAISSYIGAEIKRLHKFKQLDYASHHSRPSRALEIADRIAVMNFGIIHQIGTPDEILYHQSTGSSPISSGSRHEFMMLD